MACFNDQIPSKSYDCVLVHYEIKREANFICLYTLSNAKNRPFLLYTNLSSASILEHIAEDIELMTSDNMDLSDYQCLKFLHQHISLSFLGSLGTNIWIDDTTYSLCGFFHEKNQ